MDKTWFDRYVFDRPHYRLLKQYHTDSTPFTLAISPWLFFGVAIAAGVILGFLL